MPIREFARRAAIAHRKNTASEDLTVERLLEKRSREGETSENTRMLYGSDLPVLRADGRLCVMAV